MTSLGIGRRLVNVELCQRSAIDNHQMARHMNHSDWPRYGYRVEIVPSWVSPLCKQGIVVITTDQPAVGSLRPKDAQLIEQLCDGPSIANGWAV